MSSKRVERMASQLVRELSDILRRQISDPRLSWVTVTRAEITPDLQEATAFIRTLEPGEPERQALEALRHAEGFIRRELGRRLEIRVTPSIHFRPDQAAQSAENVLRILEQLQGEKKSHESSPGT